MASLKNILQNALHVPYDAAYPIVSTDNERCSETRELFGLHLDHFGSYFQTFLSFPTLPTPTIAAFGYNWETRCNAIASHHQNPLAAQFSPTQTARHLQGIYDQFETNVNPDLKNWSAAVLFVQVVYVARNPKDAIVSYFYHHQIFKPMAFVGTLDQFAQYYMDGEGK